MHLTYFARPFFSFTPLAEHEANPRRKCSVKGCTRKTELYCLDCSRIDHTSGHSLFFCCGTGQRVTKFKDGTQVVTQPLCYKFHLDHLNDHPAGSDDDEEDDE